MPNIISNTLEVSRETLSPEDKEFIVIDGELIVQANPNDDFPVDDIGQWVDSYAPEGMWVNWDQKWDGDNLIVWPVEWGLK